VTAVTSAAASDRVREIARFLGRYPPFDALERPELERVAAAVVERHAVTGEAVLVENGRPGDYLYVVRDGTMEIDHKGFVVDVVTKGQLFGHPTLLSGLAPEFTVRAREDTDLYLLPRDEAIAVLSRPEGVAMVARGFRDRLVRATDAVRSMPDVRSVPVTSLIRRAPVFCPPDTTVREAARLMSDEIVTALLVETSEGLGIVTDADLRKKVLAVGVSPEVPVSAIMTIPVATVSEDILAPQASIEMMQAGVNHLPVVGRDGHVLGVVSAGSLMNLDALSPFALRWSISTAHDDDAVVAAAAQLPGLFVGLLDAHLDAPTVTRVITLLSDVMTSRLLELSIARHGPPPVPFAWLALGSSARNELTLASDQDNALAFEDTDDAEAKGYFALVADEVNSGLARCGFSFDESGVLARDPHWRLSQSAWVEVFARCLQVWDWNNLLRASIAFDFRRVAGDLDIVTPLSAVMRRAPRHGGFLSGLAHLASQIPSPLGFRGRLTGPVDIKKSGLLPVINLARFYAFSRGVSAGGTVERLVTVEELSPAFADQARGLNEAYASMSEVRLLHHAKLIQKGIPPHNVIDTEKLRPLARVSLQEALRAVAAAQKLLP
jgi:CBS domain-containing protein